VWEEEDVERWTKTTGVYGPVTSTPGIVLQYDARHDYLLQVRAFGISCFGNFIFLLLGILLLFAQVNMTVMKAEGMLTDQEILQRFLQDMEENDVLVERAPTGARSLPGYVSDSEDDDDAKPGSMNIANA